MAEYSYRLTETAKEDIEQIGTYIAENFYAATAIAVIREIRNKINVICDSPKIYEEREIFMDMYGSIRIAVVKNYNIYFCVDEKNKYIDIIRVSHCSRNLLQKFIEGMRE